MSTGRTSRSSQKTSGSSIVPETSMQRTAVILTLVPPWLTRRARRHAPPLVQTEACGTDVATTTWERRQRDGKERRTGGGPQGAPGGPRPGVRAARAGERRRVHAGV